MMNHLWYCRLATLRCVTWHWAFFTVPTKMAQLSENPTRIELEID